MSKYYICIQLYHSKNADRAEGLPFCFSNSLFTIFLVLFFQSKSKTIIQPINTQITGLLSYVRQLIRFSVRTARRSFIHLKSTFG